MVGLQVRQPDSESRKSPHESRDWADPEPERVSFVFQDWTQDRISKIGRKIQNIETKIQFFSKKNF